MKKEIRESVPNTGENSKTINTDKGSYPPNLVVSAALLTDILGTCWLIKDVLTDATITDIERVTIDGKTVGFRIYYKETHE